MYDATKEFKPFELTGNSNGRHPRPRVGSTAKRRHRVLKSVQTPAPVQKGGKKK